MDIRAIQLDHSMQQYAVQEWHNDLVNELVAYHGIPKDLVIGINGSYSGIAFTNSTMQSSKDRMKLP